MKTLIWIIFALLASFWTGGAWLVVALTQWAAQLLSSGAAVDMAEAAARWSIPAWLGLWVDVSWIAAAHAALVSLLESARGGWPQLAGVAGASDWLVGGVWLVWGLGLLVMLLLAGGLHVLIARDTRPPQQPPGVQAA